MTTIRKYLSLSHNLRVASVISTDLVQEATARQELSPLSATLVGRALTGAVLMGSQLKRGQSVGLHFIGNGPIGSIYAESGYEGASRAYCENKTANLPLGIKELGFGLGKGRLDVIFSTPNRVEPHRGTVELMSGEIGDDIAYYLNQSEQIPAIVALTALPKENGFELCGGYILEAMPGVTDETLNRLEKIQRESAAISDQIRDGASAEDLVKHILNEFSFEEITHPHKAFYQCVCSEDRMLRALKMVGLRTVEDMIVKKEEPTATCEFCGHQYGISTSHLEAIRDELVTDQKGSSKSSPVNDPTKM